MTQNSCFSTVKVKIILMATWRHTQYIYLLKMKEAFEINVKSNDLTSYVSKCDPWASYRNTNWKVVRNVNS